MSFPDKYKYNKDHTWVEESNNKVTLGVIQKSIDMAGEIVFVNLSKVGDVLEIGKPYVSLESVKASVELKSPVKGRVVEVNEKVFDNPDLLNKDSFKNYIAIVKTEKVEDLLDSKKAQEYYGGKK